ncbi:hypothetical protein [Haloferula helveola]
MKMPNDDHEGAAAFSNDNAMNAELGRMLVDDVIPRLRALAATFPTVGADDEEEMLQDATLQAARLMLSASQKGRTFTAGNIAYFAAKAVRSGRRSHYTGRSDVMSPGCQLDGACRFTYLDQEVEFEEGWTGALHEAIPLSDYLGKGEDPAEEAARNLDWELFLGSHPERHCIAIQALAEGRTMREAGRWCGLKDSGALNLRRKIAEDLVEFFGEEEIRALMP